MIDNLPLKTMTHKGLTIEGYSRAAVQSYWRIPELKIGFDMGGTPWSFMGTQTFFISHSHLDTPPCAGSQSTAQGGVSSCEFSARRDATT